MKKISILFSGLVILLLIGSASCKKETTDPMAEPPSITLQTGAGYVSSNKTVEVLDTLIFGIRATPNANTGAALTGLKFALTINGHTSDTTFTLPNYNVDLSTIAGATVGTETYTFTIYDAMTAAASVQVVITKVLPTASNFKSSVFDPEKPVMETTKVWIIR